MPTKTKALFLVLFCLISGSVIYAQKDSASATSSLDLIYGYKFFNRNFYNQFNSTSHFDYKSPIQLGGIQVSDNKYVNRYLDFYGAISYRQVIPQSILIQNSSPKLNGFVFGLDYGLSLGISNKFKVLVGIGFNTGRIKLYQSGQIDQKNPFFSPKISIQPKVSIKKLVLSLKGDYEMDVSNTAWSKVSKSSSNSVSLINFKQSGFTTLFCIGMLL